MITTKTTYINDEIKKYMIDNKCRFPAIRSNDSKNEYLIKVSDQKFVYKIYVSNIEHPTRIFCNACGEFIRKNSMTHYYCEYKKYLSDYFQQQNTDILEFNPYVSTVTGLIRLEDAIIRDMQILNWDFVEIH